MYASWLWAVFTLFASAAQTLRNAMQRELIGALGAVGAAQVRFLFGLPFAILFLAGVRLSTGIGLPRAFARDARLDRLRRPDADRRDGADAGGDAPAQFRRRRRLHQDRGGAGRAVRAAVLRRDADADADRRDRPGDGRASFSCRARRGRRRCVLAAGRDGAGFRLLFRPRRDRLSRRGDRVATPSIAIAAATILVVGLAIQTVVLLVYLALFDRARLAAIFALWRASLFAGFMGALASQFWFLAFALTDAARVRTLALVEVLFAQVASLRLFREAPSAKRMARHGADRRRGGRADQWVTRMAPFSGASARFQGLATRSRAASSAVRARWVATLSFGDRSLTPEVIDAGDQLRYRA